MSSTTVAHLHVHSEYSLLDGACNIDKLAERAAAYDQPAIGLTDHGVMNGAIELYKAAKKHGVKPLLGLEAYFVDDRTVRDRKVERNHLTLLAANNEGFKNLTTLSRRASSRACTAASRAWTWSCSRCTPRASSASRAAWRAARASGSWTASSRTPARTWTSSSRSSAPRTSTSRSRRTA